MVYYRVNTRVHTFYFLIVHNNISINWKKKSFYVHNCQCGANKGYVLGLLVHGKVVVEFGRKVFLVDCLFWKKY